MATSSELIATLAEALGLNESTCANSFKELRSGGLVTNKGRGRNAAKMDERDCVMLLLAICGSEHVKDSVDAARRYANLRARSSHDGQVPAGNEWDSIKAAFPYLAELLPHHVLIDAIASLIRSYRDHNVRIGKSSKIAPVVKLSIRGPELSGVIAIDTFPGAEQVSYSPDNALDMFRTVNPHRQRSKIVSGAGDLKIEKHISHMTLQALGKLLRDG